MAYMLRSIPPNCGFEVDDAEKMWTWTKLFDFIFVRSMIGSFDDWQVFFEKAYQCVISPVFRQFEKYTS